MTRPFDGVKILDFTQVLAGPYASYQLALLGADVIKVERREGEDMRRTPLSREWADRGLAPGWQAINGNKRSLTLDLQKPEAIAIVKRLAAEVDDASLERAIADLPIRQRSAVVLRYLSDLTTAEVAEAMGITEGAVRFHLHAARRALATDLKDTDD